MPNAPPGVPKKIALICNDLSQIYLNFRTMSSQYKSLFENPKITQEQLLKQKSQEELDRMRDNLQHFRVQQAETIFQFIEALHKLLKTLSSVEVVASFDLIFGLISRFIVDQSLFPSTLRDIVLERCFPLLAYSFEQILEQPSSAVRQLKLHQIAGYTSIFFFFINIFKPTAHPTNGDPEPNVNYSSHVLLPLLRCLQCLLLIPSLTQSELIHVAFLQPPLCNHLRLLISICLTISSNFSHDTDLRVSALHVVDTARAFICLEQPHIYWRKVFQLESQITTNKEALRMHLSTVNDVDCATFLKQDDLIREGLNESAFPDSDIDKSATIDRVMSLEKQYNALILSSRFKLHPILSSGGPTSSSLLGQDNGDDHPPSSINTEHMNPLQRRNAQRNAYLESTRQTPVSHGDSKSLAPSENQLRSLRRTRDQLLLGTDFWASVAPGILSSCFNMLIQSPSKLQAGTATTTKTTAPHHRLPQSLACAGLQLWINTILSVVNDHSLRLLLVCPQHLRRHSSPNRHDKSRIGAPHGVSPAPDEPIDTDTNPVYSQLSRMVYGKFPGHNQPTEPHKQPSSGHRETESQTPDAQIAAMLDETHRIQQGHRSQVASGIVDIDTHDWLQFLGDHAPFQTIYKPRAETGSKSPEGIHLTIADSLDDVDGVIDTTSTSNSASSNPIYTGIRTEQWLTETRHRVLTLVNILYNPLLLTQQSTLTVTLTESSALQLVLITSSYQLLVNAILFLYPCRNTLIDSLLVGLGSRNTLVSSIAREVVGALFNMRHFKVDLPHDEIELSTEKDAIKREKIIKTILCGTKCYCPVAVRHESTHQPTQPTAGQTTMNAGDHNHPSQPNVKAQLLLERLRATDTNLKQAATQEPAGDGQQMQSLFSPEMYTTPSQHNTAVSNTIQQQPPPSYATPPSFFTLLVDRFLLLPIIMQRGSVTQKTLALQLIIGYLLVIPTIEPIIRKYHIGPFVPFGEVVLENFPAFHHVMCHSLRLLIDTNLIHEVATAARSAVNESPSTFLPTFADTPADDEFFKRSGSSSTTAHGLDRRTNPLHPFFKIHHFHTSDHLLSALLASLPCYLILSTGGKYAIALLQRMHGMAHQASTAYAQTFQTWGQSISNSSLTQTLSSDVMSDHPAVQHQGTPSSHQMLESVVEIEAIDDEEDSTTSNGNNPPSLAINQQALAKREMIQRSSHLLGLPTHIVHSLHFVSSSRNGRTHQAAHSSADSSWSDPSQYHSAIVLHTDSRSHRTHRSGFGQTSVAVLSDDDPHHPHSAPSPPQPTTITVFLAEQLFVLAQSLKALHHLIVFHVHNAQYLHAYQQYKRQIKAMGASGQGAGSVKPPTKHQAMQMFIFPPAPPPPLAMTQALLPSILTSFLCQSLWRLPTAPHPMVVQALNLVDNISTMSRAVYFSFDSSGNTNPLNYTYHHSDLTVSSAIHMNYLYTAHVQGLITRLVTYAFQLAHPSQLSSLLQVSLTPLLSKVSHHLGNRHDISSTSHELVTNNTYAALQRIAALYGYNGNVDHLVHHNIDYVLNDITLQMDKTIKFQSIERAWFLQYQQQHHHFQSNEENRHITLPGTMSHLVQSIRGCRNAYKDAMLAFIFGSTVNDVAHVQPFSDQQPPDHQKKSLVSILDDEDMIDTSPSSGDKEEPDLPPPNQEQQLQYFNHALLAWRSATAQAMESIRLYEIALDETLTIPRLLHSTLSLSKTGPSIIPALRDILSQCIESMAGVMLRAQLHQHITVQDYVKLEKQRIDSFQRSMRGEYISTTEKDEEITIVLANTVRPRVEHQRLMLLTYLDIIHAITDAIHTRCRRAFKAQERDFHFEFVKRYIYRHARDKLWKQRYTGHGSSVIVTAQSMQPSTPHGRDNSVQLFEAMSTPVQHVQSFEHQIQSMTPTLQHPSTAYYDRRLIETQDTTNASKSMSIAPADNAGQFVSESHPIGATHPHIPNVFQRLIPIEHQTPSYIVTANKSVVMSAPTAVMETKQLISAPSYVVAPRTTNYIQVDQQTNTVILPTRPPVTTRVERLRNIITHKCSQHRSARRDYAHFVQKDTNELLTPQDLTKEWLQRLDRLKEREDIKSHMLTTGLDRGLLDPTSVSNKDIVDEENEEYDNSDFDDEIIIGRPLTDKQHDTIHKYHQDVLQKQDYLSQFVQATTQLTSPPMIEHQDSNQSSHREDVQALVQQQKDESTPEYNQGGDSTAKTSPPTIPPFDAYLDDPVWVTPPLYTDLVDEDDGPRPPNLEEGLLEQIIKHIQPMMTWSDDAVQAKAIEICRVALLALTICGKLPNLSLSSDAGTSAHIQSQREIIRQNRRDEQRAQQMRDGTYRPRKKNMFAGMVYSREGWDVDESGVYGSDVSQNISPDMMMQSSDDHDDDSDSDSNDLISQFYKFKQSQAKTQSHADTSSSASVDDSQRHRDGAATPTPDENQQWVKDLLHHWHHIETEFSRRSSLANPHQDEKSHESTSLIHFIDGVIKLIHKFGVKSLNAMLTTSSLQFPTAQANAVMSILPSSLPELPIHRRWDVRVLPTVATMWPVIRVCLTPRDDYNRVFASETLLSDTLLKSPVLASSLRLLATATSISSSFIAPRFLNEVWPLLSSLLLTIHQLNTVWQQQHAINLGKPSASNQAILSYAVLANLAAVLTTLHQIAITSSDIISTLGSKLVTALIPLLSPNMPLSIQALVKEILLIAYTHQSDIINAYLLDILAAVGVDTPTVALLLTHAHVRSPPSSVHPQMAGQSPEQRELGNESEEIPRGLGARKLGVDTAAPDLLQLIHSTIAHHPLRSMQQNHQIASWVSAGYVEYHHNTSLSHEQTPVISKYMRRRLLLSSWVRLFSSISSFEPHMTSPKSQSLLFHDKPTARKGSSAARDVTEAGTALTIPLSELDPETQIVAETLTDRIRKALVVSNTGTGRAYMKQSPLELEQSVIHGALNLLDMLSVVSLLQPQPLQPEF